MNYDQYYTMFRKLFDSYVERIQQVEQDGEKSSLGKQIARDKLIQERNLKIQRIVEDVDGDYEKSRSSLIPRKDKPTPIERGRESVRTKAVRDINLGNGDVIDDNVRTSILDDSILGLRKDIEGLKNFMKAQSLSHRSVDWFRSEIQRAMSEGDFDRLSVLRESVSLMSDGNSSRELENLISPLMEQLKENAMSQKEKDLRSQLQELDRQHTLWKYSVDNVLARNEFRDARGAGQEPHVTEISQYRPPASQQSG